MHIGDFTPASALCGGFLIGLATALYLLLAGRYAGLSGIIRGAVFDHGDKWMDALFIAGLVAGGLMWFFSAGPRVGPATGHPPWVLIALGGLLVGFGTALGQGCTSGHGVCGLGRRSRRSFAAVGTFMIAGMATVYVVRHLMRMA